MSPLRLTLAPTPRGLARAALSLLIVLLPGLPAAAQGKKEAERLEQAEKLLRGPQEDTVRQGARACAEIDSADSMELMLAVLGGLQPHYRDIVWETLPSFKNAYARAVVATTLAKTKDEPWLRMWCAELLGLYGDADHADVLIKALGDKQPEVRGAAAQALGRVQAKSAVKALLKLTADKDPYARSYAREALARIDAAVQAAKLLEGLADPDGGARCFALSLLPELLPDESLARSAAGLKDVDWRVRLQAAQNLERSRTLEAIDALVAATGEARPIVAKEIRAALEKLCGQHWTKPEQWEAWWRTARATFDPAAPPPAAQSPRGEPEREYVRYHDLPIESDHVAFLFDASQEMQDKLSSAEGTKREAARAELERVLGLLEGKLVFNVFLYEARVTPFSDEPVALDARSRKKALAFVDEAHPTGPKDIYAALLAALDDTELDTLYLFSSGEPEVGLYVHYNRIVWRLKELERFHKVIVHGVAYNESDWYRKQIEEIAKATGGEFRGVQ